MKVNIEVLAVLLFIAALLVPLLRSILLGGARRPRAQVPAEDETVTPTKVRRRRKLGTSRSKEEATPRQTTEGRSPLASAQGERAQALATLYSGATGLRQGIILATILAPPLGARETKSRETSGSSRPD